MDGRDIGTVVLPDADVKIFLTADVEERAKRRLLELEEKGQKVSFDEVLADMKQRDYNDSHREIAPLRQADDAVLADTTSLTFDESLELLKKIVMEEINR
jgi:cytidylate kinase